jgi:hypothetical protein
VAGKDFFHSHKLLDIKLRRPHALVHGTAATMGGGWLGVGGVRESVRGQSGGGDDGKKKIMAGSGQQMAGHERPKERWQRQTAGTTGPLVGTILTSDNAMRKS